MNKGDLNEDGSDDLIISSPYAGTCADQCGFTGILLSEKSINKRLFINPLHTANESSWKFFVFATNVLLMRDLKSIKKKDFIDI